MAQSKFPGGESLVADADRKTVQIQLRIERIYVKDASFESPGSPSIFSESFRPEFKVDINTQVNSLGDDRHEVVLSLTVVAKREGGKTAYLVEIQQAGIFHIEGAQGAALQQILGIACPTTLFPYGREALDNLAVKGGFPAVQLAPVNFEAIFAQAMQEAQKQRDEQQPAKPNITH